MDRRPRIWLGIAVLLIAVYFFTGGKAPAGHDMFGGVDAWFKTVSGISISQVLFAIWRLLLWVIKFVIGLATSLLQGGLSLVKR
jgi:hypothetical protein